MAEYDLPGINILLHNQAGLRIEFNTHRLSTLSIWFSPLSGKSNDYRERNFSNRDDHTTVFDRITLPGLTSEAFIDCDYDPIHTVIRFESQTIHLLPHHNEAGLVIWTEKPQSVDFKSNPNDETLERELDAFVVRHHDRWHDFLFTARIGDSQASILHEVQNETGRSSYCRINLTPESPLIIFAELFEENSTSKSKAIASFSPSLLLKQSQRYYAKANQSGKLTLKGHSDWAKLNDVCRKSLISSRDNSGAVRAALNRIYYLIWVRDGAFVENNIAAAGWSHGADLWKKFLLANPTKIEKGGSQGRAFLMLVNQLTKWEEDGLFYAVWTAFTSLAQWGRSITPVEQETLEDALTWLENYCFDNIKGLFGRNYASESPLIGSRDFGYDNATGFPCDTPPIKGADNKNVLLSYDIYINETAFSAYCMLAALHACPETSDKFLEKAKSLQAHMKRWYTTGLPPYGEVLLEDGQAATEPPYGLDLTDYVWAFTAPPINSYPHRLPEIRKALLLQSRDKRPDYFLCGYFSLIQTLDTLYIDESTIEDAIDYAVKQSATPGETLAMPFAIKEKLDVKDGDPTHDIRPQAFSAAPFISSLSSLVIRSLPFGLALRSSGIVSSIERYEYRNRQISVKSLCGQQRFEINISIDGSPLKHSLQIPESMLEGEKIDIEISQSPTIPFGPLLVSSSVRLHTITQQEQGVEYEIECFGFNTLQFDGHSLDFQLSADQPDLPCEFETQHDKDCTFISFWGRGHYKLNANRSLIGVAAPQSATAILES